MDSADRASRTGWERYARALAHRNFRLYFVGQAISLTGTWISRTTASWLVWKLTGSAVHLGGLAVANQLPTFLVLPVAGALVDGWDRRRTMLVTQVLLLADMLVLAILTLAGRIDYPTLLVLQAVAAVLTGFDMPARQSLFAEMIEDPADLPNAIALNSAMVNGTRFLGPSLAGFLVALLGEGPCFLLDALSFVAVVASLVALRLPGTAPREPKGSLPEQIREGLAYAWGQPEIRAGLLLVAWVSLVAMPFQTLFPLVATRVLGGDSRALGALMAASGLGAMLGALRLAGRRDAVGLSRTVGGGALVLGIGLIAFSASTHLGLSLLILVPTAAGMMVQMAGTNTLLQTRTDEARRGRVLSLYAMAYFGLVPLGSLAAGALADRFGVALALRLSGAACCLGAALFEARRRQGA